MSDKTYTKHLIFSIFVCFFALTTWLDLLREPISNGSTLKYIAYIAVFLLVLSLKKNRLSDTVSIISLSFFVFMLSIFTVYNISEWADISTLVGYFVCFFIYLFLSKANPVIHYNLRDSLFYLGIAFTVINLFFVLNPAAYSYGRAQFTGFFDNANAFTGLCGLFFVLNFSLFSTTKSKYKKSISILLMAILVMYLVLGSSRGAILSAAVASFFILATSQKKKNLIFASILLCVLLIIFRDSIFSNAPSRDIFEDTGRQSIFLDYWDELSQRYFYIGTGVSTNAGRLKTELSYLDVFLMTGFIGFLGFISFIIRTLYLSLSLRNNEAVWLTAAYIYIVIASIFEGYAANVISLKSLLFYVIPALIFSNYKKLSKQN